jgi:hypothetical protein
MLSLALTGCLSTSASDHESWTIAGPPKVEDVCFERTRVIGYSQVGNREGGWFVDGGVFESIVGDERWELLWYPGGRVEHWADPEYEGWAAPLVSECRGEAPVDRVVLVVGGGGREGAEIVAGQIEAAIRTIREKMPSAREIVLHPVIGGPEGELCRMDDGEEKGENGGEEIGAARGRGIHDAAIRKVVERAERRAAEPDRGAIGDVESGTVESGEGGSGVGGLSVGDSYGEEARAIEPSGPAPRIRAGATPRLRSCHGFADKIGHLKSGAARRVAWLIATDYAGRDAECAAGGHIECGRSVGQ